jgi:hypothetical protein
MGNRGVSIGIEDDAPEPLLSVSRSLKKASFKGLASHLLGYIFSVIELSCKQIAISRRQAGTWQAGRQAGVRAEITVAATKKARKVEKGNNGTPYPRLTLPSAFPRVAPPSRSLVPLPPGRASSS